MAKRGGFPGGAMPGNMANLMKQAQKMQAAQADHSATKFKFCQLVRLALRVVREENQLIAAKILTEQQAQRHRVRVAELRERIRAAIIIQRIAQIVRHYAEAVAFIPVETEAVELFRYVFDEGVLLARQDYSRHFDEIRLRLCVHKFSFLIICGFRISLRGRRRGIL